MLCSPVTHVLVVFLFVLDFVAATCFAYPRVENIEGSSVAQLDYDVLVIFLSVLDDGWR